MLISQRRRRQGLTPIHGEMTEHGIRERLIDGVMDEHTFKIGDVQTSH
jgi:hypothetical protein